MKCSQCGGGKFIETQLWGYDFSYGQMNVEVYLCIECGHHELFNKNLAEKYRTLCKEMEDVKNKIIEQKKIVDKYENVAAKYDKETNKLISRSTSLDITIREQQELIKEIEARKKDREKNIPKSLREERAKLQQLTCLFERLKKEKANYKEV